MDLSVSEFEGIEPPNKACRRRVGVCGFDRHFSGFGLFLLSEFYLVPPTRR
ncbi:MAG: hypothetical protein HY867_00940 [Chloroflexi bacterium]|nr:hypothetical protein [Chloroflexota bacterium]